MKPVKGKVAGSKGPSRAARAAETRARMVAAAYGLFCELGFRATTMEAIADGAGVAVQTVYFTFHTKDELLQAVHEWAVLGDDPSPPPMQPWYQAAVAEPDPRRAVELLVAGIVTIESRVAPLLPVYHAVSADPAGEVYRNGQRLRREGFEELIATLTRKAPLQTGVTKRKATDLLYVLAGTESYRAFVLDAGWTPKQWVSWVTNTLVRDLFGDAR